MAAMRRCPPTVLFVLGSVLHVAAVTGTGLPAWTYSSSGMPRCYQNGGMRQAFDTRGCDNILWAHIRNCNRRLLHRYPSR